MKPDIYSKAEKLFSDISFLTLRSEYYELGDSLTLKIFTQDNTPRTRIVIQNSQVPEIDVDFGDGVKYYASFGNQAQALHYLGELASDLVRLNEVNWHVHVSRLRFSSSHYITSPTTSSLKPAPKILLLKAFLHELCLKD